MKMEIDYFKNRNRVLFGWAFLVVLFCVPCFYFVIWSRRKRALIKRRRGGNVIRVGRAGGAAFIYLIVSPVNELTPNQG